MNAVPADAAVTLITPAPPGSKAGNRATAERWAGLLKQAGLRVRVVTAYQGEPTDLLIALHAWRSREAVATWRQHYPEGPLVVVLTGTDIYRFQDTHPDATLHSMALADVLIGLHRQVGRDIPESFRQRLAIVLQSAPEPFAPVPKDNSHFDVCVVGHLREEKDSLRAALAARLLPKDSRIRIVQAGKPHNEEWAVAAEQEKKVNHRFEYPGELDREATQALMSRSRVMVISSIMEGGANVVSEACRAGLPVIASDIPGNRGLLGDDYPGYFPARDESALAEMLHRAETDPVFLAALQAGVERQAPAFTPAAEQKALLAAIDRAFIRP